MSPRPAAPSSASISACAMHVAVRVARRARGDGELDAAEHERDALGERVRVDAEPDAELRHRAPRAARSSERIRSASGGGSCR